MTQGQGLVKAMQEVPAPFFQESFDLDQRQLWEELIQVGGCSQLVGRVVGCWRREACRLSE